MCDKLLSQNVDYYNPCILIMFRKTAMLEKPDRVKISRLLKPGRETLLQE